MRQFRALRCGRAGRTAALLFGAWLLGGGDARAEGIQLNRFSPAETVRDAFYVSRPDDAGHLRFGFDLVVDYANDPLVLELDPGNADSEGTRVVSDQLAGHVGLWLGLWERLLLFGGLPVNLLMRGESFRDPASGDMQQLADGTGLGDARGGVRLRLLGESDAPFALALSVSATFPTARAAEREQNFAGEESFTLLPELLAEVRAGLLRITLNGGVAVRKDQQLGQVPLEDELRFGLALSLALVRKRFDALAEVYGSSALRDLGDREATPLEFLVGVKLWAGSLCAFGLAGGAGVTRGIGSPDLRAVASFGCDLPSRSQAPPAPPPPRDMDGDGLLDRRDGCPRAPEDRDEFEDADGCPDADNDRDGIEDRADRCALEPEDTDSFEDEDGCPDPDNDRDGIADTEDECTLEPEDGDAFEDADGCPDPDNDRDTVLDGDDDCPTAPGRASNRGCPKAVRVEAGRIVILKRVEFATGKDVILKPSEAVLDEVRATIAANPQLTRIRIEGHTDDRGKDSANMRLSRRRARSVARYLVAGGVDDQRLEAYGCGPNLPIEGNRTAKGRQTNRRVEFHIIEPAPTGGARSTEGCEPEDL